MNYESKPAFYAIIPANVRYDKNLTANAKLLYGEITALCSAKGFCWATNAYFAELYGVTKNTVSEWVSQLAQAGYITIELVYEGETKQVQMRKIELALASPITENRDTPITKKQDTPSQKIVTPYHEKTGYPLTKNREDITTLNNTSINTVSTTSKSTRFEEFWSVYPRKKAKAQSEKVWIKKKLDAIADEIICHVNQSKKSKQWTDKGGQFIPHASTYLNNERWKDEIEISAEERFLENMKKINKTDDVYDNT